MMQSNDLTASGTVLLCCPKERQMQCGIWMPLVDTGPSRHPWKLKSDHIVAKISSTQCLSIARNGMKKGTNFCRCSVTRLRPTLCNPMDYTACQTSLSSSIFRSLLKFMSLELVMLSNHLILCCPLLLLPSIFPSIRVLCNGSSLCRDSHSIGASASVSVLPMIIQD